VLAVFTDLTDIVREKQRSDSANRAKSDFLATISHEIRTPMNAILGMSEMLNRTALDDTQKKYVTDIRRSSQSLLAIINDILDFSKIEAGKLEILNSNYSLQALLDNLHSMFSLMFAQKNLAFHFHTEDTLPHAVFGDENRLRQILTNLLSNALKYTHQGSVTFTARLLPEGLLRFDIQDTGIGIREEDKSKLFMPFEQLDLRRNKNIVGPGLGLAISHKLCQLMGGDLRLESVYGQGSLFYVVLPHVPAEADSADLEPEMACEFSAPEARILVVDDIEINLAVAEAMLGAFDIEPDLAQSGGEALEKVQAKEYDIIFMDQMMPEMDGIETTRNIRALGGRHERAHIVALTANAISGTEDMLLRNRFDGYLSKPLELDALNRCLRHWLPAVKVRERR
jgi:CheY-like chemotaxis protein